MSKPLIIRTCCLGLVLILVSLLGACGSNSNNVAAPVVIVTPTNSSSNQVTTPPVAPNATHSVFETAMASTGNICYNLTGTIAKFPLETEVRDVSYILQAQITSIGALVWSTPDGKEPAQIDCSANNTAQQFAPVEITILETYKGSFSAGQKITILMAGAPNSKPYGSRQKFPKLGDKLIWFLDKEYDYRLGKGVSPLISNLIFYLYNLEPDGTWLSPANNNSLTIDKLKDLIKNPLPIPTRAPTLPQPTLNPKLQAGQSINLAQYFGFAKEGILGVKTPSYYGPIDPKKVQAALPFLDRPLVLLEDPYKKRDVQDPYKMVFLNILGEKDGQKEYFNFELNLVDNYLVMFLPDRLQVQVPPEFVKALGLN